MKKYAAYPALVLAGGAAAFALRLAQNRTGFEAATGLPVAGNLWGRLLDLCEKHDVHLHWVKGHAENQYNNRCDQLAVAQSQKYK